MPIKKLLIILLFISFNGYSQSLHPNTYTDSLMSNMYDRQYKALRAMAYIKNIASPTVFNNIRTDLRSSLEDYVWGSDFLISWLKGENSAVYGNFTTTGFPSKTYFTTQRQTDLL